MKKTGTACPSPIRWQGGKARLARRLAAILPAHGLYCEVFAGAAHLFFAKAPSRYEVINDINGELVNFFRQMADPAGFAHIAGQHKWALYSRQEFYRLRGQDPASLTERERAWRFLYLNRACFGGRMNNPTFGAGKTKLVATYAFARLLPRLERAHGRLANAQIEHLPWREAIARYDSRDTLFYLDPPYYGTEDVYGRGLFPRGDFTALAETLARISGRFVLSINDCAETRAIFGGFHILAEPKVSYSINDRAPQWRGELVFANFQAPGQPALQGSQAESVGK